MISCRFDWFECGFFTGKEGRESTREGLLGVLREAFGEGREGTGTRFYRGSWRWEHCFLLYGARMRGHCDLVLGITGIGCSIGRKIVLEAAGMADRLLRVDLAWDFQSGNFGGRPKELEIMPCREDFQHRRGVRCRTIHEGGEEGIYTTDIQDAWTHYWGRDEVVMKIYNKLAEGGETIEGVEEWVRVEFTMRGDILKQQGWKGEDQIQRGMFEGMKKRFEMKNNIYNEMCLGGGVCKAKKRSKDPSVEARKQYWGIRAKKAVAKLAELGGEDRGVPF